MATATVTTRTASEQQVVPDGIGVLTLSSHATPTPLATATLIDGKAIAAAERAAVKTGAERFAAKHGRKPGLATILIGDDPASAVYVGSKAKACAEVGFESFGHLLPGDVSQEEALALIDRLNEDPTVDGILCQLPVPPHLDGIELAARVSATKDVDGLSPSSAGLLALGLNGLRPCTPLGVMRLIEETGVELRGAEATVVGASNLVGKPIARLLQMADATVTQTHIHTVDLGAACRRADVLVVAAGVPGLIRGNFIKPGAVVIDVGINRTENGLVGDVDFDEAVGVAGFITPVPGGVGPMTIAMLLRNTLKAAWSRA